MRQLVLHHRYSLGVAWDTSGFANHGVARDVSPDEGSLRFTAPSSRIDVAPSTTLGDFGAFRCACAFRAGPITAAGRYTIVEMHDSFALYIDTGGHMAAKILDGNGQWSELQFIGGLVVASGSFHRADCGHDGLSTFWLAFDGHLLDQRHDVPGPVRPAGPQGLTIGHPPGSADTSPFVGSISEVWLWRDRPDPPFEDCCIDRAALARAGTALRRHGLDLAALRALNQDLQRIVAALFTQLPPNARNDVARTAPRLLRAFRVGNYALFVAYARHLHHVLVTAVGEPTVDAATGHVKGLLTPLADDRDLRQTFPGLLCNVARPPGSQPRRARRRRGDPYTSDPAADEYPGYGPAPRPR